MDCILPSASCTRSISPKSSRSNTRVAGMKRLSTWSVRPSPSKLLGPIFSCSARIRCTRRLTKSRRQTSIPLLHIADATAQKIKNHGLTNVGLLGTRFTMEDDFYKGRLVDEHSLAVIVPDDAQRVIVHQVIYDELCLGVIQPASQAEIRRDHGRPREPRSRSDHPWLHRDRPVGSVGRLPSAGL